MLKVVERKLSDIHPYENNARINDAAVEVVANSIKQFGMKNPILVDKAGVIIAGHTRLRACQRLGMQTAPVIVASDLTEDQVKALRIADNSTGQISEWDMEKLEAELAAMQYDMDGLGLDEQLKKLEAEQVDNYGTEFSLPDGEKSDICQMTFTLDERQAALIKKAMDHVRKDVHETFSNENSNGNALYKVIRQWAELKKLK